MEEEGEEGEDGEEEVEEGKGEWRKRANVTTRRRRSTKARGRGGRG